MRLRLSCRHVGNLFRFCNRIELVNSLNLDCANVGYMEAAMQQPIKVWVENPSRRSSAKRMSFVFIFGQLKKFLKLIFSRRRYHFTGEDCP